METRENHFNFKEITSRYTRKWKWFILSIGICISIVFIHLRYATPVYDVSAKIQVSENEQVGSELSLLQDLSPYGQSNTKVEDEIHLIKSRTTLLKVVEELKLNITYTVVGNLKSTDFYGEDYPFNINFLSEDSVVNKSSYEFFVKIFNSSEYGFMLEEDGQENRMTFGESIDTPIGELVLIPDDINSNKFVGKLLKVRIDPVPIVAQWYDEQLRVEPMEELSSILSISLADSKPQRAIDFVNRVIYQYNQNDIDDKKAVADRTSQFIDDRIAEIYNNLSNVDQSAESYKESRGIADLGSQSNVAFQQSAESEGQLQGANIQLSIANSMKSLISDQDGYEIIPTNVGISDPGIDRAAAQYNELVNQRNRLLESSNEKNPVIVKLDQRLEGLKRGIQSSLNNITNNLNLQVNSLSKQLSQINSRIYSAPSNERALRDISRKQQTTESLYLYLLQKREESQISYASSSSKSKIIDSAYLVSEEPISPKPLVLFLAAIILGILIPFSVIYFNSLLDNKVGNMVMLQEQVGMPNKVLAELPKITKKNSKLIVKDDRSVLAESFRILRTNLDFVLNSKKGDKNNKVFVTSSTSGEGKTFLSSNLAVVLASTNKRVLLIGADVRNPKLYTFFSGDNVDRLGRAKRENKLGLSEYLSDDTISGKSIINTMLVNSNTVDVIYSGKIPPNPAELLMSDRMGELIEEMSELYDYVIVDTAPLMVVTDTLLISKYASEVIYVTRSGVTETRAIEFPLKLKEEGKLPNLSFVVNDVKENNLGYGGKYGYGYGKTQKKWWKFA